MDDLSFILTFCKTLENDDTDSESVWEKVRNTNYIHRGKNIWTNSTKCIWKTPCLHVWRSKSPGKAQSPMVSITDVMEKACQKKITQTLKCENSTSQNNRHGGSRSYHRRTDRLTKNDMHSCLVHGHEGWHIQGASQKYYNFQRSSTLRVYHPCEIFPLKKTNCQIKKYIITWLCVCMKKSL